MSKYPKLPPNLADEIRKNGYSDDTQSYRILADKIQNPDARNAVKKFINKKQYWKYWIDNADFFAEEFLKHIESDKIDLTNNNKQHTLCMAFMLLLNDYVKIEREYGKKLLNLHILR